MQTEVSPPSFMKYDPRNDVEVHPVSNDEERLIERFFKECYHNRVISYAEKCEMFKRKKLFEMLRYASQNMSKDEVTKRNLTSAIQGEKPGIDYAFTANGGFGLSYSSSTVTGKRSSRKISPQRFQSPGISENAIFGYPSMSSIYNNLPTTNQMPNFYDPQPAPIGSTTAKSRSIQTAGGSRKTNDAIHLTIIRMVKPDLCQSLINISDEYSGLWLELSKIIDKRGLFTKTNSKQTYGGLSNSQAILDLSPAPFMTLTPHRSNFDSTTLKTRDAAIDPSSSNGQPKAGISRNLSFSLRLNDPALRNIYKSDTRWSPRNRIQKDD
ncbi:hypothetical protein M9Y10_022714 [Tritrichomonas musculus]|uniref:Initiator binding domain-containing protein n=1 Tax=Tritrichomonas musculus TaxID=1915356 RepID=A0ABR2KT12_9EUKA